MSSEPFPPALPSALTIHRDGTMDGRTASYEKHLSDMLGIYSDPTAFQSLVDSDGADTLVYSVQTQMYREQSGALIVGTSTLLPRMIGNEFSVTRGHLHAILDRAELYYCLSGHGVMLLEAVDGQSKTIELNPGQATNVPSHWIHRSVNVGTEPFVTLFCYSADAGQNYDIISDAGGMSVRIVDDGNGGWTTVPNVAHRGYNQPQLAS